MSDGLEAAGALATAGLVARAIDGAKDGRAGGTDVPAPSDGGHRDHAHCLNCGAALNGSFCAVCGQSSHVHHSLLHLAEEVLHGLLHFDAKGWRTLPLLVARPGVLTRRYIEGQRARYVSPLALFLFMVFLMFFAASLGHVKPTVVDNSGAARVEMEQELAAQRRAEVVAQTALAHAKASGGDVSEAEEKATDAHREVVVTETSLKAMDAVSRAMVVAGAAKSDGHRAAGAASDVASASARVDRSIDAAIDGTVETGLATHGRTILRPSVKDMVNITLGDSKVNTGSARLDAAITHAIENPDLTVYKLKNTAYKFSFLLVPLSLPFLWLIFLGRRVALYDHAVFVLYSLSFMSLLFVVLVGMSALGASALVGLMTFFLPPIHLGAQLRDAYRLSLFGTLWRTVVLLVVANVVLSLFVMFILYVTMA